MSHEFSELKGPLTERVSAFIGDKKAGFKQGHNTKKDIKCYNCGKRGHMARERRGGRKQRDDPDAAAGQKRTRQAEGQGKDQQNMMKGILVPVCVSPCVVKQFKR